MNRSLTVLFAGFLGGPVATAALAQTGTTSGATGAIGEATSGTGGRGSGAAAGAASGLSGTASGATSGAASSSAGGTNLGPTGGAGGSNFATGGEGDRGGSAPGAGQSPVMSRGLVETAQWGLRRRGHNVPADGNLDRTTQRALAEFQRSSGLPVTGMPDPATLNQLGAAR